MLFNLQSPFREQSNRFGIGIALGLEDASGEGVRGVPFEDLTASWVNFELLRLITAHHSIGATTMIGHAVTFGESPDVATDWKL